MAEKSGNGDDETRPLLGGDRAGGESSSQNPPQDTSGPSSPLLRQVLFGLVVSLPGLAPGMSLGYCAVTLHQFVLLSGPTAWYGSVVLLGFALGGGGGAWGMKKWGRRKPLLTSGLVGLVGWLLLSVRGAALGRLITGRLFTGISGGLASVAVPSYAQDLLPAPHLPCLSFPVGIFLAATIGPFLPYHALASIAALITILSFILSALLLHEPPTWAIRHLGLAPRPTSAPASSIPQYKPLLLLSGFLFFQQFSGSFVFITYMVDLLRATSVSATSSYGVGIVGALGVVIASVAGVILWPRTGLRGVLVLSAAGSALSLLCLGTVLALRSLLPPSIPRSILSWLAPTLLLSSTAISSTLLPSSLPLPFPSYLGFFFSFLLVLLYPYMLPALGVPGLVFFYAAMALVSTLYVLLFLPVAKLQEISHTFVGQR